MTEKPSYVRDHDARTDRAFSRPLLLCRVYRAARAHHAQRRRPKRNSPAQEMNRGVMWTRILIDAIAVLLLVNGIGPTRAYAQQPAGMPHDSPPGGEAPQPVLLEA